MIRYDNNLFFFGNWAGVQRLKTFLHSLPPHGFGKQLSLVSSYPNIRRSQKLNCCFFVFFLRGFQIRIKRYIPKLLSSPEKKKLSRICLILDHQRGFGSWRHGPPHDAVASPFVSSSSCIQFIPFAASSTGNTSLAYSSTPLHPAHKLLASAGAEISRPK